MDLEDWTIVAVVVGVGVVACLLACLLACFGKDFLGEDPKRAARRHKDQKDDSLSHRIALATPALHTIVAPIFLITTRHNTTQPTLDGTVPVQAPRDRTTTSHGTPAHGTQTCSPPRTPPRTPPKTRIGLPSALKEQVDRWAVDRTAVDVSHCRYRPQSAVLGYQRLLDAPEPANKVFSTPHILQHCPKTTQNIPIMTTNRPFFGGFLAAFRAQPVLQKAATSQTAVSASSYAHSTSSSTSSSQSQGHDTQTSTARTITTKAQSPSPGPTTVSVQATGHFQPTRQHAPPYNRSTSPKAQAYPIPGASQRSRRGSDSSSEGFHEVMGAEKWYIGGRTATGEDKYYKLGMVKRHRSADRLSLDKLSI
ncbi:hypothetical protein IAQ61_001998 [Plenodomus lingam]|uniref:uncharacterized protein n=1 Tax=Leptosphaeria maculans TaxID=5022 RepID=UPI00331CAD5D|nr:hypothetical protein IAQ61_001998 [Plenodomus lingam]